ncbi:MAG: AMP-binding protein [Burkholderiaceae bacterium]|nr:AMP-binding protein [Burkholderiaceae bacterium]
MDAPRWIPTQPQIEASNLTAFLAQTGASSYEDLLEKSNQDPAWLMEQVFQFSGVKFYRPFQQTLDLSRGHAHARWCVDGTTNIVLNCLDQHLESVVAAQPLLIWEGEPDAPSQTMSYAEFNDQVCRLAAGLRRLGVERGDVVAIYLPILPESFVAFFSVLKLGAILLPLFSGFGAQPIATRLVDGRAKIVITADITYRRGAIIPMKTTLDEALLHAPDVKKVVVIERNKAIHASISINHERDVLYSALISEPAVGLATEHMDPNDPAMLFYTSGTTGKPKGCVWTHIGFLGSMVTRDMHICGDFKSSDRFFFMSDMGWMVGAMCAMIPTMFGGSLLIAEGAPDYPSPDRFWRIVQDHRVTYLGVSPSLVRGLMHTNVDPLTFDLSALRMTVSGGEVWTEDTWNWFFEKVCQRRIPIINITGGTEVGGAIMVGTPNHPMNVGSFSVFALGMGADIVDETGQSLGKGQAGELVLRHASIGMTKSLWFDDARYLETYWSRLPGVWVHGDLAMRGEDGLFYMLGRSDDTIKIAGKRMGPSEIESQLLATGKVIDAAAVALPDEKHGAILVCVCVLAPGVVEDDALIQLLIKAVADGMGASYRPRRIVFTSSLPRTRNMKLMRRVVKAVLCGEPTGDLSSLINPESVDALKNLM